LVTVTGKLTDCPVRTSPNRKLVGLKANWVEAAAGIDNPAVKTKATNNKKKTHL
jgi:hypothetical protein